jgi:hypothetical protein
METKYLIFLIAALILVFSISATYLVLNSATNKVIAELSKLNPTKSTIELIKVERCTRLNKTETEWLITGCKDDITIHLIFQPMASYYMKICGGWTDAKTVAQEAKDVLRVLGIVVNCDVNSITLLRTEDDTNIYNVCGGEMYLSGRCLV